LLIVMPMSLSGILLNRLYRGAMPLIAIRAFSESSIASTIFIAAANSLFSKSLLAIKCALTGSINSTSSCEEAEYDFAKLFSNEFSDSGSFNRLASRSSNWDSPATSPR